MTKEHESEPLTLDQRALAEYMSELSEEAYFVGWMTDLEYNLWEAVLGIRRRYGLITISQAKVQKLKALADAHVQVGLSLRII